MLRILNHRLRHVRGLSSTATIPSSDLSTHKSSSHLKAIQQFIDEDQAKGNPVPVFKRALIHSKATALKDLHGEFTYTDLLTSSKKLSTQISEICGKYEITF